MVPCIVSGIHGEQRWLHERQMELDYAPDNDGVGMSAKTPETK